MDSYVGRMGELLRGEGWKERPAVRGMRMSLKEVWEGSMSSELGHNYNTILLRIVKFCGQ